MADSSENGDAHDQEDVSSEVVVFVEKDTHSVMLAIAQSAPNVLSMGLNSGREEFLSICIAGVDYERSISAQRAAITLRLRYQAMWRAAKPYQMEMCARKDGSRISPALTVSVEASLIYVNHIALRLGSELMACGANFSNAKITSDASTPVDRNQIFVHRRQIYLPRYHIARHLAAEEVNLILQSEGGCRNESLALYEHTGTYIIPETEFIVVSRYHSRHIASLKTGRNPCYANSTEPRQNFSFYPY
ncbi:unnamed protein product [Taenia asiatica]|uniref:T-box domain-containing protein n=1 Tax=Taenia asiatica TaxID=60517 RepID=A0A0R3WFU1_TAEAS|nr:unnamed protein product [Taenia asiatica]